MNKVSDETILRAQEGDASAFQEIYEAYYNYVFYHALKLCKNEANAKDVTQDVFIQVYRYIKNLREIDCFNVWLNRIVHSRFIKFIKKNKEVALESQDLNYFIEKSNSAKGQHFKTTLKDDEVLQMLIGRLSKKQSEVLSLMYFKQYTIPEISKIVGCPEGTVKSRLDYAKKMLAKEVRAFEKLEGRKLSFGADMLLPTASLGLIARITHVFHSSLASSSQALLVASASSMVVMSAVAIHETNNYIKQNEVPQLVNNTFEAVVYEDETVSTAKQAYYELLNWSTSADPEGKEEIIPIYESLQKTNSEYYELLKQNVQWNTAYK